MRTSRIAGWGTALPDKVVTNADLEAMLDTSDEWIVERSGIRERRIGGTTSGLAVAAGRAALHRAGVDPASIGLLVLATSTPDQTIPASSATVQHQLGLSCGGFDVNAACSSFVYALVAAHQFVTGGVDRVLVIGAETMSRIIDWDDRSTAVLFGDGAGAFVLEAVDAPSDNLLAWDLGSNGALRSILDADVGGFLQMEGKEVFRQAIRAVVDSAGRVMASAGVDADDIALVVPHQANVRIIDAVNAKLGFSIERTAVNLDRTGNTSSASIPMALAEAAEAGRLKPGDLVLFMGFGAGMTWASAIMRWDAP
ncbi:MAG: 3-oxoacyl-[acyl-carrier-protein] synthase [Acidimicrobiaceae bacterium]